MTSSKERGNDNELSKDRFQTKRDVSSLDLVKK